MSGGRLVLGESSVLPQEARNILLEAAKRKNTIVLDNAIETVKRKFPQFFKPEEFYKKEYY